MERIKIGESCVEDLKLLAMSKFGLVNNRLRRQAWPLLLNIDFKNIERKFPGLELKDET